MDFKMIFNKAFLTTSELCQKLNGLLHLKLVISLQNAWMLERLNKECMSKVHALFEDSYEIFSISFYRLF